MTAPGNTRFQVIGDWLAEQTGECTCGFGDPGYPHEPSCGWEPLVRVEEIRAAVGGVHPDPAPQNTSASDGAALIAAERARQVAEEGWTAEHDERHSGNELAWAATCYAAPDAIYSKSATQHGFQFEVPWPMEWTPNVNRRYRPWRRPEADRLRELMKAGALIAAEIDRLQRAESGSVDQPAGSGVTND